MVGLVASPGTHRRSHQGGAVQVNPIYDDELAKQLVGPLPEGAQMHCFVDACKGVFALGLPSRTYTRADGWSAWEACPLLLQPPPWPRSCTSKAFVAHASGDVTGMVCQPHAGGASALLSMAMVQEDGHGPDGAYLHPSMGGEAIMLSSSLAEEDDADADLAELSNHASMGTGFPPSPRGPGVPQRARASTEVKSCPTL